MSSGTGLQTSLLLSVSWSLALSLSLVLSLAVYQKQKEKGGREKGGGRKFKCYRQCQSALSTEKEAGFCEAPTEVSTLTPL